MHRFEAASYPHPLKSWEQNSTGWSVFDKGIQYAWSTGSNVVGGTVTPGGAGVIVIGSSGGMGEGVS